MSLEKLARALGFAGDPKRLLVAAGIAAFLGLILGMLAGLSTVPYWLGGLIAAALAGFLVTRL